MENKQRQIAYKVTISEVLEGKYVKEGGWVPNYVVIGENNVSRINIVGIIIAKIDEGGNGGVLVDDKTGNISIRTFDNSSIFDKVGVGDIILLIGRPREYNNEKYVVPEIIKKINKSWFELRLIELNERSKKKMILSNNPESGGMVKEDIIFDRIIKSKINSDGVLNLIRTEDKGDGVDYEQLVEKVGNEKIIKMLLEEGEIFEVTPGRLKVL